MSKWTSAKERLPAIGRFILLYDGCSVMSGHLMQVNAGPTAVFSVESGGGSFTSKITHWQEMPNPPDTYTTDGKKVYYKGNEMTPMYIASLLNLVEDAIDKLAGCL